MTSIAPAICIAKKEQAVSTSNSFLRPEVIARFFRSDHCLTSSDRGAPHFLFSDGVDVNIDVDFDLGLQGLVVPQTNVAEVLRLRNFEKTYGFIMLMFLYCLYFQIIYICYLV